MITLPATAARTARTVVHTRTVRVHRRIARRPETIITSVMSASYAVQFGDHFEIPAGIMFIGYIGEAVLALHRERQDEKTEA